MKRSFPCAFLMLLAFFPCLMVCQAASMAPEGARINALDNQIVEYRVFASQVFLPVATETIIPPGAMIAHRNQFFQRNLEPVEFRLPEGVILTMFPGTVLAWKKGDIRLLEGRFVINVPEKTPEYLLWLKKNLMELKTGEAMGEVTPDGKMFFALKKGSAWIKGTDGNIYRMSPGKQLHLDFSKEKLKLEEMDGHWRSRPNSMVHLLEVKIPPPEAEVGSEPAEASASADLESDAGAEPEFLPGSTATSSASEKTGMKE